jgi:hypothetical protein
METSGAGRGFGMRSHSARRDGADVSCLIPEAIEPWCHGVGGFLGEHVRLGVGEGVDISHMAGFPTIDFRDDQHLSFRFVAAAVDEISQNGGKGLARTGTDAEFDFIMNAVELRQRLAECFLLAAMRTVAHEKAQVVFRDEDGKAVEPPASLNDRTALPDFLNNHAMVEVEFGIDAGDLLCRSFVCADQPQN